MNKFIKISCVFTLVITFAGLPIAVAEFEQAINVLETTINNECAKPQEQATDECKTLILHLDTLKQSNQPYILNQQHFCDQIEAKTLARAIAANHELTAKQVLKLVKCIRAMHNKKSGMKIEYWSLAEDGDEYCQVGESGNVFFAIEDKNNNYIAYIVKGQSQGKGASKEYTLAYDVHWNPLVVGQARKGYTINLHERKNIEHVKKQVEENSNLGRGIVRTLYVDDQIIVQDHYDGKGLDQWLDHKTEDEQQNRKKMQESESWRNIAMDLSYGLKNLHSMGVIHSDVKPANSVVKNGNNPKTAGAAYTDLGLSVINPKCNKDGLLDAKFKGTPIYTAPEANSPIRCNPKKITKSIEYAQKRDVYAHALTLYELKYGNFPIQCPWLKNLEEFDKTCLKSELLKLQKDLLKIGDNVDRAIALGIEFDPKKRVSSEEFVRILEQKEIPKKKNFLQKLKDKLER